MLRNIKIYRWISFKKYFDQSKKLKISTIKRSYCVYLTNVDVATQSLQTFSKINLIQASNSYLFFKRNMSSKSTKNLKIINKYTNRLSESKSPYLLQHAHNPVDWYPWGDEAIDRARREKKLIFLSVGYSTCHWCHVMERESFENEAIAKIMNEKFVNIKVDREERPDIDKIYMNFLVMINGSGGWPMSVWLTPELAPIAAGTYFPPQDRWGMPSFKTVLNSISSKWNTNQEELKAKGLDIITAMKKSLSGKSNDDQFEVGSADQKLQEAIGIFKQRFDTEYGGFGFKPKFPEVPRINFLFHAYIITKDLDVLDIALSTLKNIGRGGIHDHVFGGFARYAVDRNWHIPHFEKMLYDQGQLMSAYSNAFKLTGEIEYLNCAEGIFNYINKDLSHPEGGFYAGEDADSLPNFEETIKVEGAFYAWNWDDIKDVIIRNSTIYGDIEAEKVFEIYSYHYSLKPEGNVQPSSDPQCHLKKKNILFINSSEEKTSNKFNINKEQLKLILNSTNNLLHDVRKLRPRPHLDTKIICSWNGLVLSGLAKLYSCGSKNSEEYLKAASRLVRFLKNNLYDEKSGQLIRSCYGLNTEEKALKNKEHENINGFLDDYAFLIKGLLDYYKVSLDSSILHWAKQLQDMQDKLFWDDVDGGYFYSEENSSNILIRLKEDHDGAEPCGNSVAAHNLVLISHYFDEARYRDRVCKLFNYFSDKYPFGFVLPEMMSGLLLHEYGLDLVAIVGPNSSTTERFIEICRKFYVPEMVIVRVDPNKLNETYSKKLQEKFKMVNGMPTVYICHNKVCRMPVVDPEKLQDNLMEKFFRAA